jgi:ribosomal protein S18 acetylase RimI-like enzyme
MKVRQAEPGDEAAVAGLHVRSWQVGYRGLLPNEFLDGLRPEDRAARYTFADQSSGRPETMLAVEQGVICGFTTVGASRDTDQQGRGEVYAIYVDPASWGRGIGRILMAEAQKRLALQGFREGFLWVAFPFGP